MVSKRYKSFTKNSSHHHTIHKSQNYHHHHRITLYITSYYLNFKSKPLPRFQSPHIYKAKPFFCQIHCYLYPSTPQTIFKTIDSCITIDIIPKNQTHHIDLIVWQRQSQRRKNHLDRIPHVRSVAFPFRSQIHARIASHTHSLLVSRLVEPVHHILFFFPV